jgi:DNA invertase Pin-like site-specific DNA recombinase
MDLPQSDTQNASTYVSYEPLKGKSGDILARISKNDENIENQLVTLRSVFKARGIKLVAEYIESHTGREGIDKRKEFKRFWDEARTLQYDIVYVMAVDRFTREGGWMLIKYLKDLNSIGKTLLSHTQSEVLIDTPVHEWITYTLGQVALMESWNTGTRNKTTRLRLIKEGRHASGQKRREVTDEQKAEIRRLRSLGYGYEDIANSINLLNKKGNPSIGLIRRVLAEADAELLTQEQKETILSLYRQGKSYALIAQESGQSIDIVSAVVAPTLIYKPPKDENGG